MKPRLFHNEGYTLIEMIVVVIVIAILASVAMRSLGTVTNVSRLEKTRENMNLIANAIVGSPAIGTAGTRGNYGYIGDNGCVPSSLDELIQDSHSYPTWNGPYLGDRFSDGGSDAYFKKDGWGRDFGYNGLELTSNGSGTQVSRRIADSYDDLLYNRASFAIVDLNHTPPGPVYKDSVRFSLLFPRNGIMQNKVESPDAGGFVTFDSLPIGIHTLHLTYLPTSDTITRRINIEPSSQFYAELQYPADIWGGSYGGSDTLLRADFNTGTNGFVYGDDLFRGTSHSAYASGIRLSFGGFTGGALQVSVGGIDNANISGMSGGWSLNFSVPSDIDAVLSFHYNLTQTPEYEHNEYSEALVSNDGTLFGTFPHDYVARVVGNGHGGGIITTGWQLFQVDLGTLSAGTHTIVIGEYNSRKTRMNESTEILIDDVLIVTGS